MLGRHRQKFSQECCGEIRTKEGEEECAAADSVIEVGDRRGTSEAFGDS